MLFQCFTALLTMPLFNLYFIVTFWVVGIYSHSYKLTKVTLHMDSNNACF